MRRALNIRDPRWCASWRAALVLVLLGAAVYLPGLFELPTIDRDEARFAQASRQMFESVALPPEQRQDPPHAGGLVVPMVQDRPRLNKPPLIYWLQTAAAAILTAGDPMRDAIWMYRVPSLLAAIGTVLIVWRMGRTMFDPRAAFTAAAMLCLCPLFVWEARQARADHALVFFTTLAMWGLWEIGRRLARTREVRIAPSVSHIDRPSKSETLPRGAALAPVLALWIGVALGTLTKGPVTLMVVALAAGALALLRRDPSLLRATRPALGAFIVVAAFLPWLVLLADRYGLVNYLAMAYDETLGRAGTAKEGHAGPPGYHLVLLIVMFWPGSMVTGLAVCRAWSRTIKGLRPWKWRANAFVRPRRAELFCLCWALPPWIVFELIATKLPHYIMPLLPPLALISARTLLAASAGSSKAAFSALARTVYVLWIGLTAILLVGATGASILLFDGAWAGPVVPAMALLGAILFAQVFLLTRAAASMPRRKVARAMRAAMIGAVLLWASVLGLMIPRAPALWLTPALLRALHGQDPDSLRPLLTMYQEDSLIFGTRGRALIMDDLGELDESLAAHPDALVILPQDVLAQRTDLRPLVYIRGFNLARFRSERLALAERAP